MNPFREALGQAGLSAFQHEKSFKPEADAALASFQSLRDDLERHVRRGDLTLKVAREKTSAAASRLKESLTRQAAGYSPVPRVFLDRLVEACNARKRALDHLSLEGLQRETNRLLRMTLIEQQLQTRIREFEGRTHTRSMPGGMTAPSLESLLSFHHTASQAGDEAAVEWGRRQLEAIRPRVMEQADLRKIDQACDRPDAVNPRIVSVYLEALKTADSDSLETFVTNALEGRDANACVASFLFAREQEPGSSLRWVRNVLNGLGAFPEVSLTTLRTLEAEARGADFEAARAQADYAIAIAQAQVDLTGVEAPTNEDLALQSRLRALPVAKLGEPIGLRLARRGALPDDSETEPDGVSPTD